MISVKYLFKCCPLPVYISFGDTVYLFQVTVYLAGLVYLTGKICMKNFSYHRETKTFCFVEKEYCDMM